MGLAVFHDVCLAEVPLLPNPAGHQPPFIFKKGPESGAFVEAQQRLCCPIAGPVFIKKITATPASSSATEKKRARAPDLSTEQPPKKAKSKAKGKAKAKAIEKKSGVLGAEPETAAMIQEDVSYVLSASGFAEEPLPAGARQRLWLDDLLSALNRCRTGPFKTASTSVSGKQLYSLLLAYGLEFALTGSVRVSTKPLKEWSKAAWLAKHDCCE